MLSLVSFYFSLPDSAPLHQSSLSSSLVSLKYGLLTNGFALSSIGVKYRLQTQLSTVQVATGDSAVLNPARLRISPTTKDILSSVPVVLALPRRILQLGNPCRQVKIHGKADSS